MSRLFFALWPGDRVRDQIEQGCSQFSRNDGRIVNKQNWHITVVFLGNVPKDKTGELVTAAAQIKAGSFDLTIDHSGWWRTPKVVWLAPSETPAALLDLFMQLNDLVRVNHLTTESRPYKPHLTLLRKVRKSPDLPEFTPIHWNIREFCLVESVTLSAGVHYQVIEKWPLSTQ